MTKLDWERWPPVAVCGRLGAAVGLAARGLPAESPGCGTSCGSSRDIRPDPKVSRKPRPEPCRQTARCGGHRGPVAAPARRVLVAVWAVMWLQARADSADAADRASRGVRPNCGRPLPCPPAGKVLQSGISHIG